MEFYKNEKLIKELYFDLDEKGYSKHDVSCNSTKQKEEEEGNGEGVELRSDKSKNLKQIVNLQILNEMILIVQFRAGIIYFVKITEEVSNNNNNNNFTLQIIYKLDTSTETFINFICLNQQQKNDDNNDNILNSSFNVFIPNLEKSELIVTNVNFKL